MSVLILTCLIVRAYCKPLNRNLSFVKQIELFSQARTIVAPHGAGLSNMVWASGGLQVLEIFPSGYFNDCYARLSVQLGFGYDYITCDYLQGETASGTISVADVMAHLPVSSTSQTVGLASVLQ